MRRISAVFVLTMLIGMIAPANYAEILIGRESNSWRFSPGNPMDSNPLDAWRNVDFDDTGWFPGQTSIGYGDGDDNTVLDGMLNRYTSVYLRHTFTIDNPESIDFLLLNVLYDDAFVVWVNGELALRQNINLDYYPSQVIARQPHEAVDYEQFYISPGLQTGTNVLAIHGVNYRKYDSDFSIDAELISVPEPATFLLLALGTLMVRIRKLSREVN